MEREVDMFALAMSKFKRQKYKECIDICTELLEWNKSDYVSKLKSRQHGFLNAELWRRMLISMILRLKKKVSLIYSWMTMLLPLLLDQEHQSIVHIKAVNQAAFHRWFVQCQTQVALSLVRQDLNLEDKRQETVEELWQQLWRQIELEQLQHDQLHQEDVF